MAQDKPAPHHLSLQLMPFYHGSDHPFREGDTVDRGWTTRSRIVAGLYGNNVYEVEPNDREDPGYGGHRVLRKVERDDRDESEVVGMHEPRLNRIWEFDPLNQSGRK